MSPLDFLREELVRGIIVELNSKIDRQYKKIIAAIAGKIKKIVRSAILDTHEYRVLTRGNAFGEIGDPNIYNNLQVIIQKIVDDIEVEGSMDLVQDFSRGTLSSHVSIKILSLDYSKLTNLSEAVLITEKGVPLPWLEWLLLEGERTIIYDFKYIKKSGISVSRTGRGIMVKNGTWSVPPDIAGTQNDNWLTRAINAIDYELRDIVEQEFQKYLGS